MKKKQLLKILGVDSTQLLTENLRSFLKLWLNKLRLMLKIRLGSPILGMVVWLSWEFLWKHSLPKIQFHKTFFSKSLSLRQTKLECLSLVLLLFAKSLLVEQHCRMLRSGKAPYLLANIRLACNILQRANVLAYFAAMWATNKNFFIKTSLFLHCLWTHNLRSQTNAKKTLNLVQCIAD